MQRRPGLASSRVVMAATHALAKPCLRFWGGVKTRCTRMTPTSASLICSRCARLAALLNKTLCSTGKRLSRVSWNLSGGPPPDTARGVGVGHPQRHHQEGDHRDHQVPADHPKDESRTG